jgi:uncharacterized protein YbjQ (UPF0145 family)
MSTTDSIPGMPQDREIRASQVTWSDNHDSIRNAYDSLAKWAIDNNCDAIVGIRLEAHQIHLYPNSQHIAFKWAIYGTAIAWGSPCELRIHTGS